MNQSSSEAGFTLIEVMIAIGIMTVGALGILSMHQALSKANRSALEMNTALAITERWIERIERDSLEWTEQGPATSALAGTDYLAPLASTATQTAWLTPSYLTTPDVRAYAFDHFGNDVAPGGRFKYCTNIRLSWLRLGSSARVDVRTYWFREGHMGGAATHANWVSGNAFRTSNCAASDADGWGLSADQLVPNIDVVYASTVVTWLRREGT